MTVENPVRIISTAVYLVLIWRYSTESRNNCLYCRFWVIFGSNCSRLSYFVETYCHKSTWKRSKQQYIKNFFLLLLSFLKNHVWKRQYRNHFLFLLLSIYVIPAVETQKSEIRTVGQNQEEQLKWDKSSLLLLPRQCPAVETQKTNYELSAISQQLIRE